MWITNYKTRCVEIDDNVFNELLSFYPEEKLVSRPVLSGALKQSSISYTALQSEAETLFISWQMFLLDKGRLGAQLQNIETNRADKISLSFLSKRSGRSGHFSMRLLDRFIRIQNFLVSNGDFPKNNFNESLIGLDVDMAVPHILSHFKIDVAVFRKKRTVTLAIDYLVDCISKKNINVARGTTAHGLMPSTKNHTVLYGNMSGFCLKDDTVPLIYLSTNEVVGEEVVGRQIYTLIYLVVLIGLGVYSLAVNAKSIIRVPNGDVRTRLANLIASELLVPKDELALYKGSKISWEDIKSASLRFRVTPRAILFRMKTDKIINQYEHDLLLNNNPYVPTHKKMSGGPKIETSVRKLGGDLVFNSVNARIRGGTLRPIQAQIILFGKPNQVKWKEYKTRVGLL